MASKRKASAMASAVPEEPVDPADELMFLCLGGGNEVGRSCHIIQYKGKTVMVRRLLASSVSFVAFFSSFLLLADIGYGIYSSMPVSILHTMDLQPFHFLMTLI
jgi:hypothetical protein